jgi:hypothetical protein
MDKQLLDIYTDYLISSFSRATATGLSELTDGDVSHDKVTRFLSASDYTSENLWLLVKPEIRRLESDEDGVIIFDDTICEKNYTDENEIICWHFDHSKGRSIKGINLLNCIYNINDISIPVAFEIIAKDFFRFDEKSGLVKRTSPVTKNELLRNMLGICTHDNKISYKYVLTDIWFSSKENMNFIINDLSKEFIMAIKGNRNCALSPSDRSDGNFVRIDSLNPEPGTTTTVWLKGTDFPVALTEEVFKNKDGSTGVRYLVCSDTTLGYRRIVTIFQRRWKVEEFHKALKSCTSLGKSPTRVPRTQKNHCFASVCAFFKLEQIKMKSNLNHFVVKNKIYIKALKASFGELQKLINAEA